MRVVPDSTVSRPTTLSSAGVWLSAPHMFHDYFSEDIKQEGEEYTSMRKQNKIYFNYCLKVKLYDSNIFLIIFLGMWHRFKFPTTKYFMYILIAFMKILLSIIYIICDNISMYV